MQIYEKLLEINWKQLEKWFIIRDVFYDFVGFAYLLWAKYFATLILTCFNDNVLSYVSMVMTSGSTVMKIGIPRGQCEDD
jgi:hypothetical protein